MLDGRGISAGDCDRVEAMHIQQGVGVGMKRLFFTYGIFPQSFRRTGVTCT